MRGSLNFKINNDREGEIGLAINTSYQDDMEDVIHYLYETGDSDHKGVFDCHTLLYVVCGDSTPRFQGFIGAFRKKFNREDATIRFTYNGYKKTGYSIWIRNDAADVRYDVGLFLADYYLS